MNRKTSKIVCGILSFTIIASSLFSLAGCTSSTPKDDQAKASSQQTSSKAENSTQEKEAKAPGSLPIVDTATTLNLGVFENPIVADFKDNELTKWLTEKTGIDFEFTLYPEGDDGKQKIELQIASQQELPDILMQNKFTNKSIVDYGTDGLLVNLDKYFENDAFYFDKAMKTTSKQNESSYKAQMKAYDGHIYGVPQIVESPTNDFSRMGFINKAWLEKLKLEMPKTTDDLYTVLKAFAEKDPNGNGKNDEIPFAGSLGWMEDPYLIIQNSFLYCPEEPSNIVKDGKVDVYYTQDEYRESLRYMNKLCKEKLLSPVSFTQDNPQYKAMVNIPDGQPNKVGLFVGYPSLVIPTNTKNILEYDALPLLTGPKGVSYTAYYNSAFTGFAAITKYCKTPDVAFKFLDFMFDEEASMRARYGVKGVDWKDAPEGSHGNYEDIGFKAKYENLNPGLWGTPSNKVWHTNKTGLLSAEMSWIYKESDDKIANHKNNIFVKGFGERYQKIPDEIVPKLLYNADEEEQISPFKADLDKYWLESRTRFIVGDMDIEKDWDKYIKQLETIGLSKYLAASQSAYDRTK